MDDLYALEPESEPDLPGLPGDPVIREHEDQLLDALTADIYLHALNCVQAFGDFHVAIAVGPFQERLCRRMMTDPAVRELPWQRTNLWAVHDAPDPIWGSCFTSVADLLEDHSGIPDSNIHLPSLDEDDPAAAYERRLQERLAWREKGHDRLDLVVLHLQSSGSISGIASADAEERLYLTSDNGGFTMTPRLLNATRLIALTALGEERRAAVAAMATNKNLPRPAGGTLRCYIDRAASGS